MNALFLELAAGHLGKLAGEPSRLRPRVEHARPQHTRTSMVAKKNSVAKTVQQPAFFFTGTGSGGAGEASFGSSSGSGSPITAEGFLGFGSRIPSRVPSSTMEPDSAGSDGAAFSALLLRVPVPSGSGRSTTGGASVGFRVLRRNRLLGQTGRHRGHPDGSCAGASVVAAGDSMGASDGADVAGVGQRRNRRGGDGRFHHGNFGGGVAAATTVAGPWPGSRQFRRGPPWQPGRRKRADAS